MMNAEKALTSEELEFLNSYNLFEEQEEEPVNAVIELDDENICRICYNTQYDALSLIQPCLCSGTIAFAHCKCLESWLNHTGRTKCDLCLFEFNVEASMQYGMFESIPAWIRQRRRGDILLHDLCVFIMLNILTPVMIGMTFSIIHEVNKNEEINSILPLWYHIFMYVVAAFWIGIYVLVYFLFFSSQILPWYQWWRSMKKIRLVVEQVDSIVI